VAAVRLRTVDAFTEKPFSGNPAAVVVLDQTPRDEWMAALAREMNLSETAFVLRERSSEADFRLRWFTPTVEVDLCGHATLAAAHCLFEDGFSGPIRFATRSGVLIVERRTDGSLAMDFPASPLVPIDPRADLAEALGVAVKWTGESANGFLIAVVTDEQSVRGLVPDIAAVARLDADAVVVTAPADPGRPYDFVSRVFGPRVGIDEDPVTGSAHVVLAPYWVERLGRKPLRGLQVSPRSGTVGVEPNGDRVLITGHAVSVLDGVLTHRP
jgi:PhzF family phenazine biosynthesis protein